MARGSQGRPIFANNLDHQQWLGTLAEGCEKTGWQVQWSVTHGEVWQMAARSYKRLNRLKDCLAAGTTHEKEKCVQG
jgi:hypothetical protein